MPVSVEQPILTTETAEKFIDENTIGEPWTTSSVPSGTPAPLQWPGTMFCLALCSACVSACAFSLNTPLAPALAWH